MEAATCHVANIWTRWGQKLESWMLARTAKKKTQSLHHEAKDFQMQIDELGRCFSFGGGRGLADWMLGWLAGLGRDGLAGLWLAG